MAAGSFPLPTRGEMHNPVTGSGGTLTGVVDEVGGVAVADPDDVRGEDVEGASLEEA
jgi:hypothetical protein